MTNKPTEVSATIMDGARGLAAARGEFLEDDVTDEYISDAQVSADSFGLLILPWDAEPMVGDVVMRGDNVFQIKDSNSVAAFTGCKDTKIIARKGYKAVIQEDKDNVQEA